MTELTRDGAAAGAGGLVIANISKYGVINGKLINPAYSDSGEPDRATRWPKRAPQGDFPILKEVGNISFVGLISEASSDEHGRMIVGRAPDNYPATCAMFLFATVRIRFAIRTVWLGERKMRLRLRYCEGNMVDG
ncbi:hypothetical protein [Aeromonas caviae]|uniref:hypothetical protein n=1 Tax=Aeromonas caviae TaxID=648 RepID=UPI002B4645AA|nr:hypothetical protein [Aeromonas caviae]